MDDDHEDRRVAKIAKNEQDKERRRPEKVHKNLIRSGYQSLPRLGSNG
jgi:hypothetical protein